MPWAGFNDVLQPSANAVLMFASNTMQAQVCIQTYGSKAGCLWYPSSRFAPGQSRRIFSAKKILSTPSFGGEVKPSAPCRSFTACKRSLNVTSKSAFRQNSRTFLAHSSTFRRWVLSRGDTRGDAWWRKLERLTQIAQ